MITISLWGELHRIRLAFDLKQVQSLLQKRLHASITKRRKIQALDIKQEVTTRYRARAHAGPDHFKISLPGSSCSTMDSWKLRKRKSHFGYRRVRRKKNFDCKFRHGNELHAFLCQIFRSWSSFLFFL